MRPLQPISWKRNAPDAANLTVRLINDDLKTRCNTYWALTTATNQIIDSGNMQIDGTDYANWDGDNDFPYTFVAGRLGVTLLIISGSDYGSALGIENL